MFNSNIHSSPQEFDDQKKLRAVKAREDQEERQRPRLNVSVKDVFGDAVTTEEADFVDEEIIDPSKKPQN